MGKKPTHDICVTEKYINANGEEKDASTQVGSAWASEGGAISCELRPGIALNGRFVLFKKTDAGS